MKRNLFGVALLGIGVVVGALAARGLPQAVAQDKPNPHGTGGHKIPPAHVTVRYLAGDRTDVMGIPAVTGFDVESLGGDKKFLVCKTAGGQRVYFAYEAVVVVDSRALGSPAVEGIGKDAAGEKK